jgi:hypothetical protein
VCLCASAGRVINHVWVFVREGHTLVTQDIFGAPHELPGPPANSSLNYLLNSHSGYESIFSFLLFAASGPL